MASLLCEKAISEALHYGNAILKFISPNDVGVTGGHQSGFYLPKAVREMYTPDAPQKGRNAKHPVFIEWQDGRITKSMVTWYGTGTRSEYRLTRFQHDFPYLIPDTVGDLLVLIPKNLNEFLGYVFDLDEDIEEIIATLGVQPFEHWAIYRNGAPAFEDKNDCLEKQFYDFAKKFTSFPPGSEFSNAARVMLMHCYREAAKLSSDEKLLEYTETEYRLFQVVERQICQSEIGRLFKDVDDFLKTAASIMNRRKARAGRSLENHVDNLLREANLPHAMQPEIDGKPDIVIPDEKAYFNSRYPVNKLFIVGVKTTCKDRWRQVLNEGRRVRHKHILTLQPGISSNQLDEMHRAGVTLIVPKRLQKEYPKKHTVKILTLDQFILSINKVLNTA
jgi:EcoRII C terminal/Restriction endonuclease EcoRII, N-terminal